MPCRTTCTWSIHGQLDDAFPPDLDTAAAAKAKRDLERLLRASASWDTAGRMG